MSIRGKIWKQILNIQSSPKEKAYFDALLEEDKQVQLMIDEMLHNDVKRTCDDDSYFVFEETIEIVMRAFARDTWIRANCNASNLPLFGIDQRL